MIKLDQAYAVHSAEDNANSKALGVGQKLLRHTNKIVYHNFRFVVLVLAESS
jgi:hypothetical protein